MKKKKIIFAIDGEIEEGPFSILALSDGTVIYTTPVGVWIDKYRIGHRKSV